MKVTIIWPLKSFFLLHSYRLSGTRYGSLSKTVDFH